MGEEVSWKETSAANCVGAAGEFLGCLRERLRLRQPWPRELSERDEWVDSEVAEVMTGLRLVEQT